MGNVSREQDREKIRVDRPEDGVLIREKLITDEQRGAYCRMFNRITLEPGSVIGYHEHHGETETYYLLTGKGIYEDDGAEIEVEAGDVTFCDDGHAHGLKNTGSEPLTFLALILEK